MLQGALEHWVSPKDASNEAKGLAAILNLAAIAGADGLESDACSSEAYTILGLKPADVATLVQKALKR
jgi:hypothetical protein